MTYVLALSLGPVQDFIASARRTRDLWFGSYLLSQASKAAAEVFKNQAHLIFPTAQTLDKSEEERGNVSNKLLVMVEGDAAHVQALAEAAVKAARDCVLSLAQDPLSYLSMHRDLADLQVSDLLEAYWAAAPMQGGPEGYALARAEAERWLASRKNTRDFASVSWGAELPKSQLDGQRESVLGKMPARTRLNLGMQEAEELCGPGVVKRTGVRGEKAEARFMSTSHVASQPFLAALSQQQGVKEDWDSYIRELAALGIQADTMSKKVGGVSVLGHHDGRMLYGSRLPELLEKPDRQVQQQAQQALDTFLRRHKVTDATFGPLPPEPYYALFQADGDGMGKLIDAQSKKGHAEHSKLSDALSEFAGEAGRLVREAQGSLIYAGGDDVLALLPLHTAMSCAVKVAEAFKEKLKRFATPETPASLSGGLVIAHFLTPLQESLDAVRKAEKTAKNVPGKDALCLGLYRRSGSPIISSGKWEMLQDLVSEFAALYREGALPHKFAYNVRVLAAELGQGAPLELAQLELGRILSRKRAQGGEKNISQGHQQRLMQALGSLSALDIQEKQEEIAKVGWGLRRLSDLLILGHVLARAQAQAGLSAERQRSGEVA